MENIKLVDLYEALHESLVGAGVSTVVLSLGAGGDSHDVGIADFTFEDGATHVDVLVQTFVLHNVEYRVGDVLREVGYWILSARGIPAESERSYEGTATLHVPNRTVTYDIDEYGGGYNGMVDMNRPTEENEDAILEREAAEEEEGRSYINLYDRSTSTRTDAVLSVIDRANTIEQPEDVEARIWEIWEKFASPDMRVAFDGMSWLHPSGLPYGWTRVGNRVGLCTSVLSPEAFSRIYGQDWNIAIVLHGAFIPATESTGMYLNFYANMLESDGLLVPNMQGIPPEFHTWKVFIGLGCTTTPLPGLLTRAGFSPKVKEDVPKEEGEHAL